MTGKATGWDARDARLQAHRADVVEEQWPENPSAMQYRWECTCRRSGKWTDKATAGVAGARHERRFAPKPQGPAALRKLLKLS